MSEILITIAIPTYNNEHTIEKALLSCINQETEANYEVLVVNNFSIDNTLGVVSKYASDKVRIISNDNTVSLFENHNVCLKNSLGKYVLFCHSDDKLEKHAVKTLVEKIRNRNYPDKYVLLGHSMFRDFQNAINNTNFRLNEMIVGESAPMIFFGGGLTPSGTCYSRESFLEIGGFLDTSNKLSPSDMTTMIYLALNGFKFEMVDEMFFLRENASTARSDISLNDMLNAMDDAFIYLFKKISINQLNTLYRLGSQQFERYLFLYYTISIRREFRNKILVLAIKELIKSPLLIKNKIFIKIIFRTVFNKC